MRHEAWVVVDLGFGDAGKGSVTDFLVRDRGADLVVRFNGGAQAGHNVVTEDGRHHTFSQFCSGTFAGVQGLLGPDFLLHPLGMWVEARHLEQVGLGDPWALTWIARDARVISPYQQAAGQMRERLRGAEPHGTCGVGVGECVADSLEAGADVLRAFDLGDARRVRRSLRDQRECKRAEMAALGVEDLSVFDDDALIERVVDAWRAVAGRLRLVDADELHARIDASRCVVFEGAQGVLLDQTWGFHPHTTWSSCTPSAALVLAGERPVTRLGILRAYGVRHGAGPFPTEGTVEVPELHNASDGWQGRFRVGALDGVLLRYALEVSGGVDALAITCLDRVPEPHGCDHYHGDAPRDLVRRDGARIHELVPGEPAELGHRERLGRALRQVRVEPVPVDPIRFVERATGLPVRLRSDGPTARHKRWA